MNKLARGLLAAIIAAFLVVIIAMIAMAHGRSGTTNKEGALESTLRKISSSGVHATALSLSDLYGPEWVAGAMICPVPLSRASPRTTASIPLICISTAAKSPKM